MMIKILHENLDYIFGGNENDPRSPELLFGDRAVVEKTLDVIKSASPYTHFAMSHEPGDRPSRSQIVEDALVFLRAMLPDVDLDDLAVVVVLHQERAFGDRKKKDLR